MAWPAIIAAGGAIVGGIISSRATGRASDTQSAAMTSSSQAQIDAARIGAGAMIGAAGKAAGATKYAAKLGADASKYATDKQWEMYQQAREDQLPWLNAGKKALGTLEQKVYAGPGEFTESPGYQFRLDQGNKNILSNQAATGNLASGRTLKALQDYGQDYASYEYDKFLSQYYQSLSPLQSLAGVGLSSAQSVGGMGIQTGMAMGQSAMSGAQIGAGAYNNLAGIYGNLGNNLASNYMQQGQINANNIMQQGNLSAASRINQGNIWSGVINDVAMGFGKYYGGSTLPSSQTRAPSPQSTQNAYMSMSYL